MNHRIHNYYNFLQTEISYYSAEMPIVGRTPPIRLVRLLEVAAHEGLHLFHFLHLFTPI